MTRSYLGAAFVTMMAASATALLPNAAHADLISIGASYNGGTVQTLATGNGTSPLTATGMLGSFVMTATATGAPLLPQPTLDTSSIDVSTSGSGVLEMFITEQGLTAPAGVNNFLSSFTFQPFTGSGILSVVEETFVSASNALFGGTFLAKATDTSGGIVPNSAVIAATPFLGPNSYSETVEYIITAGGFGSTNDTVNISAVPEPATFGIFGASLGLMALIARRRRSY